MSSIRRGRHSNCTPRSWPIPRLPEPIARADCESSPSEETAMASDSFDYVIVGAGSAGCVLADRLSAESDVRIALLEAGPRDRKLEIKLPAAFPKLFHTKYDWDLFTTS